MGRGKIFVTRSSMPPIEEYIEEIRPLWESRYLTNMGSKHEELKEKLKGYLGVPLMELFTNGHMALELTLQAMDLAGEVITTPFTFASTTHAIVRAGMTPVFCDIRESDYTMDPERIESLITDKTSAILPVHVYGNVCDTEKIEGVAKKHGLKVIYDAAHAFGETLDGRGVGSFGDASMFSFHATKVFHTIEGGAVCFPDSELEAKLQELRDFGIVDEERIAAVGANAKMHEFSASMGLCNLRHVDEEIEKRKKVYERYLERLRGIEGLRLNIYNENIKPNYSYFPIYIDEKVFGVGRDEVFEELKSKDIYARKYFYPLTNTFEAFHGKFDASETPIALRVSKRVLTLPMYADLDLATVDDICNIVISCRK
ncbi:MAG: DegT/DnrJ/EryC1/StrS family aminotransferase [Lachnospiraceae bacterium]|nr:DegT/DnrJ/EryC1/StrS family aminotransferase [Lachnospiraceae bacterium]